MPFQAPAWTEFYACPICGNDFSNNQRLPISLGCGHTICRPCLGTVYNSQCPFDQTTITTDIDNLPINTALLQLFNSNNDEDKDKNKNSSIKNKVFSKSLTTSARTNGAKKVSNNNNNNSNNNKSININKNGDGFTHSYDNNRVPPSIRMLNVDDLKCYKTSKRCIEELAQYLKSFFLNNGNLLTRPMLRKIVALANCQLMEEEGRIRAIRTARLLGERTVTELLLQHQNPQQLSLYLWAAVRSRGCQFLGPAMQEEVLKLVLKALENGSALSRKVLVMYVVQRLVENLLPASKTSIGHVVQLLYRASCFKVSKREGDSSLMQLKEEFRNYEALRREHDAQIVQIATEAGLRIAPDQWSSLLYGNITHKSHMQSICDTLQSPSSFSQSVQELILALQRTGDPTNLFILRPHLKHLASIDTSLESSPPLWQDVENALTAVRHVVLGLVKFVQYHNNQNLQDYQTASANYNGKYKISLCRDHAKRRICPRGENCTFAHSTEERQRYRAKNRKSSAGKLTTCSTRSNNSDVEKETQLSSAVKSVTKGSPQHLKQPSHHHSLHTQNVMQTCNALSLHINSNTATSSPVKVRNSLKEQLATYENVNSNLSDIVGSGSGDDHTFGGLPLNVPFQKEEYYPTLHGDNRVSSICHQLEHEFNLQPSIPPPGHYHEANTTSFNSMDYNSGRSLNMLSVNGPNVIPRNTRESTSMIGIHTALSRRQANMTTVVTPPNSFSTLKTANSQSLFNQHTSNKTTTLFTNSLANYFYHNDAEENDERNAVMNGMSSSLFFNTKPLNANNIVSTIDVQATNTKFPLSLKSNIAHKASTNTWDAKSPEFNSIINSNDLLQTSHNRTFVTPKVPESKAFAIDKNLILENTAVIQSSDTFIIKNNNNSNLNNDLTKSRSSLLLWKSGNNLGTATEVGNATSTILNDNAVNIETSLFHDRESFVRSDSILDDDASTFDVPTTSTALGSKYGPICPMYKGLPSTTASTMTKVINRSVNDHPQTGDLGYTWDDLKIQTGSHNVINSIIPNDTNLSVFPMGNKVQSSSSSGFQDKVESVAGPSHVQSLISDASDSSDLQSVLSKLSCLDFNINNASNLIDNVCANGNGSITSNNNVPTTFEHTSSDAINVNNMKFDLSPLADILPSKTHTTDLKKTFNIDDGLIGTSVDYNHVTQQQQEQQKIHFNNFWSDNVSFPTEPTNITLAPTAKIQQQSGQQQSYSNLSQEQYNHDKHKVEATSVADNRLDITDIVDRIWPCIDKNDNAYE